MKSKQFSRILAVTMAGIITISAVGCSSQGNNTNSDKKKEKESIVKMAVSSEPDNLNPMMSSATDTQAMMMNVYEGLLTFDKNGNFLPALAESYDIKDGGKTYDFKLKKDIEFHNGDKFDSGDVKYTYETLAGLNGKEPLNETLANELIAVETPDKNHVQLKLNQVDAGFLSKCTISIQDEEYTNDSEKPIGTGPYKFKEYVQGQKLILEKNKNYKTLKERTPEIDRVEFKIMTDSNAVLMALQSGDLDIASVEPRNMKSLESDFNSIEGPQNMVQIFALNNSIEPFNKLEVRQAINYAVNKKEIIDTVMQGHGTQLESFLSPSMKNYYNDDIKSYNTNIEKAKELLAKAGYPNGFQMTITVPSNYQAHVDTAQMLKDQLAKVGIKVDIQLIEWAQWLDTVYSKAEYEATVIGHSGKLDPQDFLNRFTTTYAKNYFKYSNPEYDQKIIEAASITNETNRAEIYKECQQMLADDAASVFIQDPSIHYAVRKNIEGMQIYPVTFFDMGSLRITE